MEERFLSVVSLVCSVVGLVLLFFISASVTGAVTKAQDISSGDVGRLVTVCGELSSVHVSKSRHLFLVVDGLDVVVFNGTIRDIGLDVKGLKTGSRVCVQGTVQKYKGKLEIIGEGIRDD
jgi:DNA/RNA endonuclease YhcR with UshA esterase domain